MTSTRPSGRLPSDESDSRTGPALMLLVGLLALLPVVFWRGAPGAFEPVKGAILQLAALGLLAVWPAPLLRRPRGLVVVAVLAGCASAVISTVTSVNRAQALEQLGRPGDARAEYEAALSSSPGFPPAARGRERLAR